MKLERNEMILTSQTRNHSNKVKTSTGRMSFQSMIFIVVTLCAVFSLFPLFITVINAFKTSEAVSAGIFIMPESNFWSVFMKNMSEAWGAIGSKFFTTILVAIVGAVGTTFLGAALSYILVFKNFYFKNAVFMLFIAVLLVPSIIGYPTLVPLIRDTFHLGDTYFGYVIPTIGGAQVGAMFLFRTFFSQQPKSLYESAKLEGANDFKIFFRLTIPLALPILLYYGLTIFTSIYNDFLWASLILSNKITLMPIIFTNADSGLIGQGAVYAMYVISSLPLIITTFLSMKYFASGEFASGMKL